MITRNSIFKPSWECLTVEEKAVITAEFMFRYSPFWYSESCSSDAVRKTLEHFSDLRKILNPYIKLNHKKIPSSLNNALKSSCLRNDLGLLKYTEHYNELIRRTSQANQVNVPTEL